MLSTVDVPIRTLVKRVALASAERPYREPSAKNGLLITGCRRLVYRGGMLAQESVAVDPSAATLHGALQNGGATITGPFAMPM